MFLLFKIISFEKQSDGERERRLLGFHLLVQSPKGCESRSLEFCLGFSHVDVRS